MKQSFNIDIKISAFMEYDDYKKHEDELCIVAKHIFNNCKNLDKICFIDYGGGNMTIGGCYPENGYDTNKTKFTWNTLSEAAVNFIKTWNPDGANAWNNFIEDGEKYGWE